MNYYNEIDPHAAAWLRELIKAGAIPHGDVDERSIEDVCPTDLHGYTQCHFFAGIGGWSHALDLAGWPRDRPVWTGSCPCQPFSAAGKGAGFEDERHLWPAWQHIIAVCKPPTIFGEQVASKAVDAWIDLVQADLEGLGYAVGSVPFPAAGVGAPHLRDRNYWMAHTSGEGLPEQRRQRNEPPRSTEAGMAGGLADAGRGGVQREQHPGDNAGAQGPIEGEARELQRSGAGDLFGGADDRLDGRRGTGAGPTNGHWRAADWLFCRDGKWRPVESGTFPLAHGLPARVGRLRGYGNAIVPQAAAAFIEASVEAMGYVARELEAAA